MEGPGGFFCKLPIKAKRFGIFILISQESIDIESVTVCQIIFVDG